MRENTLYVTDLDGTLLNRQDRVSAWSRETLNRLVREGLPLTYATARSQHSASVVTAGLELTMPVVVYNGAFLAKGSLKNREILSLNRFTSEQTRIVAQVMQVCGVSPLVYAFTGSPVETVSWVAGTENDGLRYYFSQRPGDPRFVRLPSAERLYEGDVFYYTCIGPREELEPVYEAMRGREGFRCTLQQELYRPEYFCEIMPERTSKANAIRNLCRMMGFTRLVSFGDAINDEPMFRISDVSCAVENAVPSLRAMATNIIPSNEEDGVARWLLENAGKEP